MKIIIRKFLLINQLLLISTLVLFIIACDSTDPLFDHYQPEGEYKVEWNDLPTINDAEGLKLGGFSGLYYAGGRIFYTITDRGPVIQESVEAGNTAYMISPDFIPQIVKLELQDDHSFKVIEQKPISNSAGNFVTGKMPEDSWVENEEFTNSEIIGDSWGIYPSGVLLDIKKHFFWFSDQYQPGLYQATIEGKWVRRIRPAEGMRRAFGNQIPNGGLTGIDFTTSGSIITIMGRCLENNRAPGDIQSNTNYGLRRIGLVNIEKGTDLSMFYFVQPEAFDGIPERLITLGDIATVNDTSYLVTEYGHYDGLERNLLYMISVGDTTTKALVGLEGIDGITFETLSKVAWKANEINAVNKRLLLDLSTSNIRRPDGIAIIDADHIAIIDNNEYGIVDGDPNSKTYQLEKKPINLEIFTLPIKLDLK